MSALKQSVCYSGVCYREFVYLLYVRRVCVHCPGQDLSAVMISAPSCICHGESPGVATVTGPLLVYCTEAVVQFLSQQWSFTSAAALVF